VRKGRRTVDTMGVRDYEPRRNQETGAAGTIAES
jgi:hypothetical protein